MPGIKYQCKKILRLENFVATLIYGISNWSLGLLQLLLSDFRKSRNIKTILLFRTGNLGDTICAIPALRALRRYFLSARIILFTDSNSIFSDSQSLSSLIGGNVFNEIIFYKAEDLRNPGKLIALIHVLRKHKIDTMVYFSQYDVGLLRLVRDMLFFSLSGCRKMYGFRLNKHRLFRIAQSCHRLFDCETRRLMKIMIPLGIYEDNPEFNLPITPEAKQQIDALLPKTQDFTSRLKIVIHPGAKFPVNRWPRGKFLGLVRMLIENLNAFVILVGGKDTSQTCSFIEADVKSNILNLCGKTSIVQTAEIILRSKILVSGDSGPLHLSEAVGTAAVGIYTARDYPNCWYPWSNKSVILRHDVKCQVCFKTNCETRECIDGITVEEVFAACKKICETQVN